ncbi:MAG TPA: ABC transporter permease [Candidatus Dormibacteraeota bacterium]|nr:ABC transporter permease [Candidatus Dormibacteraeota bacterium]
MILSQGHLRAGVDSVRSAKLRSFWTMLGVIIGVTAVISVVAIGEGVKQQIAGQIHHLGNNFITIRPAQLHTGSGTSDNQANLLTGLSVSGPLTVNDITTVGATPGLADSTPLTITSGSIKGDYGTYNGGFVIGTSDALPSLLNQSLAFGAYFSSQNDGDNVAVLGQSAANSLFNETVPLGRSFLFHGQSFIVVGIFNQFTTTPLSQEANFNNAVFIPNSVAETLTNNTAPTYEILARPTVAAQTASVAANIRNRLNAEHGGQSGLSVLTGNQNIAANDSILELLTRLIAGVAAISLLVGGIGIMNVMLVSVTERTHEIGIRKAIGATNLQILSQFIIEATLLSLSGGLIGIVLSYAIDLAIRLTTTIQPSISWQIVAVAGGVALLIGVIFGSVPAFKAARKNPIESLRSE